MKKPLIQPHMLISPVKSGYVVYDTRHNRLHELNPTAALLFELCNGHRTITQIAKIASQFLPDNADTTVSAWIVDATETGLLIDGDGREFSSVSQMSADDLIQLAADLRDEGLVQAAYVCQEHAVSLAPKDAPQLRELGELAHILGKRDAARDAFERYLSLVADDAEIRHLLTSLRDEQPPERVPDECIQQLYHRFASFYESNMCGELGYEGPKHLCAVIDEALGDRQNLTVLDLGCGTGLAGLAVQDRAKRLVGVDLSPEMIEQARNHDIYHEIHTAEVTHWLNESDAAFDLIIACDTFIYFGDLSTVLRLCAAHLTDTGCIAFSVERATSGSHQLTDNGRYVHHRTHLQEAAHRAGLKICSERQAFLRMEYGVPVDGLYVCLTKIAAADSAHRASLNTTGHAGSEALPSVHNSAAHSSPPRVFSLNPVLN